MINETITLLREAILLEREQLANDILLESGLESVDQDFFNRMIDRITAHDKKQYKQIHAFEIQKVHDEVNFGRLQHEVQNPNEVRIFDKTNPS